METILHPILFITSNLGGGGAERALVNIVNHLDRNRFKPYLALFQKEGSFLDEVASDIPIYEIQPKDKGFFQRNLTRFNGIHEIVSVIKPSLIMSMLWQVNSVLIITSLLRNLDIPIVINEQTAPKASLHFDKRRKLFWPIIKGIYRRADMIIAISNGIATELHKDVPVSVEKIRVIHNPIFIPSDKSLDKNNLDPNFTSHPAIIAVGRLTPLKNYSMLLRAISLVLMEKNVALYILGQGPEKETILSLAESLGISSNIHLLGFVPNPMLYMSQADVFTLTSDHEGFGNVLIEAMSLRIPVIATDCPYGPREILGDSEYGILVPVGDVGALAEAILSLLNNPEKRQHLAELGWERSKDFSVERIVHQYEKVFIELIQQSK